MWDTIIIGGGPAGLSAALLLGRSCRSVRIIDEGIPRNVRSKAMHGFLSRDGIPPLAFLQTCREELEKYDSVSMIRSKAVDAERTKSGFLVTDGNGDRHLGRTLLLAAGIVDRLPEVPNAERFYGSGVYHCPYCDGWEHRNQPMAVYGSDSAAVNLSSELLQWSGQILLCTDGSALLSPAGLRKIERLGIVLRETEIACLEGELDILKQIRFADGNVEPCSAFFFSPRQKQSSELARRLGCRMGEDDQIQCEDNACTGADGVFAAGNASTGPQFVIMAAAEGTQAAYTIHQRLLEQDQS